MNDGSLNHVEAFVSLLVYGLQTAVRSKHLQPNGKEKVDLAGIFAQGGEAGSVIGHVEGGADAFLGIQLDLRRRGFRLAMAAMDQLTAALFGLFFFLFLERMERALLLG